MALYRVTGPDGNVYEVNGPEGATDAQIIAAVQREIEVEEYARSVMETRDVGLMENILSGLGAGAVGTLESAALGGATLLDEEQELEAREAIKSAAEAVRPEGGRPEDLSYQLASGVGSLGAFLGTALLGPAALPAAGAMAVGAGAGEASERARAAGISEEDRGSATLKGALVGATEILPLGRFVSKLGVPVLTDMVNKLGPTTVARFRDRVRNAAITGGIEGAQEATAAVLQNAIEQGYNPDQTLIEGATQEGGIGAFAGALLGLFLPGKTRDAAVDDAKDQADEILALPAPEERLGLPAPEERLGLPRPQERLPAPRMVVTEEGQAIPESEFDTLRRKQEAERESALTDVLPPEALRGIERNAEALRAERIRQEQEAKAAEDQRQGQLAQGLEAIQRVAREEAQMGSLDMTGIERELSRRRNAAAAAPAQEELALAAAERGDEAEFAQPDLFPVELLRDRERFQGPTAPDAVDAVPDARERAELKSRQLDLVTRAEDEAELARMLAEDEAARMESELESLSGRQLSAQERTTEQRRRRVLLNVIEATPSRNYNKLIRAYREALSAEGIQNTNPTEQEITTIQRAVNVQRAFAEDRQVPTAPESTQLSEMEALIPERGRKTAGQPKKATPEVAPEVAPEVTEQPAPKVERKPVTAADLKDLSIPKIKPVYKEVIGKDLNDPAQRQEVVTALDNYAKTSRIKANTKQKIQNFITKAEQDVQPVQTQPAAGRKGTKPSVPSAPKQQAPAVGRGAAKPAGTGRARLGDSKPDAAAAPKREGTKPAPLKSTAEFTFDKGNKLVPKGDARSGSKVSGFTTRSAGSYNIVNSAGDIIGSVEPSRAKLSVINPKFSNTVGDVWIAFDSKGNTVGISQKLNDLRAQLKTKKETKPAPLKPAAKKPAAKKPVTRQLASAKANVLGRPLTATVLNVSIPQSDAKKLRTLPEYIEERKEKVTDDVAAGIYFRRYERPVDAMQAIAFDIANKMSGYTKVGNAKLDAHFEGTGAANARKAKAWIDANLSDSVKNLLGAKIKEETTRKKAADKAYQRSIERQERERAIEQAALAAALRKETSTTKTTKEVIKTLDEFTATSLEISGLSTAFETSKSVPEMSAVERNKLRESIASDVEAFLKAGGKIDLSLTEDAVVGMVFKVHPAVNEMVKQGNLQGALYALSKTAPTRQVRNAAAKMADKIGNTKVVVEKNLKNSRGMPVAGLFDPKTNTIKLNQDFAGNAHTLLHETAHAVTSATLSNKSHPLTKQLQKLFDDVKDQLSTHYGAQSLDEFVAEVYTNPEFRAELSRVYPKESNTSALRKVINAIVNFFRKLFGADTQTKLTDSNLNETIETIMAPAPDMRNAGSLYMAASEGTMGRYMDNMGERFASASNAMKRIPQSEFSDSVREFIFGTAPRFAKKALLASLPSQAAADQTARLTGSKKAYRLHELYEEQEGATSRSDNKLDAVSKSLADWRNANKDKAEAFDRVVIESTLAEVDPSKPRTDYKGDKALEWDKLQADWKAIEKSGRDQYIQLRDAYRSMYDHLLEAIETSMGSQARKVFLNIFPKKHIEPYFPLVRKGDYWVKYTTPDGEYVFEAFETNSARDRHISELKAAGATNIDITNDISKATFNDVPSASFVGQVIQIMQANKVDNSVIEDTMRLFVQMLPATSFAKSLQKRKGVAGFKTDALFAFREKAYSLGRQIAAFEYSKNIRNTMEELREEVITKANAKDSDLSIDNAKILIEEWDARTNFAVNPPTDIYARMTRVANRIAFLGTIGFNVSSAIVNFSQLPLFVLPYLAGRTSYKEAQTNIYTAMKLFNGSGFNHRIPLMGGKGKTIEAKGMPSIDNYYQADENGVLTIRTDIELDNKADFYKGMTKRQVVEAMLPLVQKAADRGLLNRSLFYDTLGAETSGKGKNIWDKINAWSAFSFHTVERHNRQVSLVANFLNELTRLETAPNRAKGEVGLSDAQKRQMAVENALYETQQTNGGAVLATAPRIAQKHIGRVAMMYKTYGIQMYYTQLKTAFEAINATESDPEVRRIARRQLVGTTLAVLAMSGVQGLTLFGIGAAIANMFLDDDEEDAETMAREYLGEGLYKGLLNQITGVDVAARIGLSNLILQSNRYNFDPSMEKTIVSTLGGPFYGYGSQVLRGVGDLKEGEVQRGIENMLPSAFRNVAKTFRYVSEDGINTRRGDPIFDDMTPGLFAAQFLGFAPAEYTRNMERNQVLKRIDRTANEDRTKLLRKYYIAMRFGDTQGMRTTMREIAVFNRKHPSAVITPETIKKSMAQHMKTSATMYNGVTLSPNMRARLEEIGRGFE